MKTNARSGRAQISVADLVSLVTAVLALVAATIGLASSFANRGELTEQRQQIASLRGVSARAALSLTITVPVEHEVITDDVYDLMEGEFTGELAEDYRLWILARERYNYFLMYPPTQFTRTMGRWSQTNVRLGTPGRWELHVCVANREASAWFEGRASRGDWSGFATLPEGAETVRYVVVEKE